jgi:hypothetical protein
MENCEEDSHSEDEHLFDPKGVCYETARSPHELLGYTCSLASEYREIDDSVLYLFAAMNADRKIVVRFGDFVCNAPGINNIKRLYLSIPESDLSECTIACVASYSAQPPRLLLCTADGELLSTLLMPLIAGITVETASTAFEGNTVEVANEANPSSSPPSSVSFQQVMRNSKSIFYKCSTLIPSEYFALCMCAYPGGVLVGCTGGYVLAVQLSENTTSNHLEHAKGDYEEVVKLGAFDIKSIKLCRYGSQKCIVVEDSNAEVHVWLLRPNSTDERGRLYLDRLVSLRTRNPRSMLGVCILTEDSGK